MNNNDIRECIAQLARTSAALEDLYIDNGGEITEDTEAMEEQIEAMKALLNTEGVDSLGRWLKAKEDEKQAIKNEKNAIAMREKAVDKTIDFIKYRIGQILRATGEDKVKGSLYAFQQATSRTTSVDTELVGCLYDEKVKDALKEVLPPYITVKLGASVKAVPEGTELPDVFVVKEEETVKFTKPRAAKASKEE